MNVAQLKAFCAGLPGAEGYEHGAPANILVYSVGGKRFAHFKTSAPERWRFSLKVAPERFLELTDVPGIRPARWLARHRWITIVDVAAFPGDQLRELVEWSWRRALDTLPRARREAILGASAAQRRKPPSPADATVLP
ncbi:MmcQ/YjbR family DNA-binding protein [Luteimonas sp. SJ-92]|uniref:MmcQ/YjbR family DNA-binding protein n=1 Tax=Luteimonas salinisoli TaxID=2752307 RepID=A0A853JBW5_9GAMM|nr:MmcQ/YjbR family DNA-binding protein [Luteimonas salinisoli]NZA26129.1 MmcQ/YjbR family DNA-binding protein [Luteimonas salinisoli]